MKNILLTLLFLLSAFTITSCDDPSWGEVELVETTVWEVTTADSETYYYYPEYSFLIVESGVTLTKYQISDWSISEPSEGSYVATLDMVYSQEDLHTVRQNITFSATYKSGTISMQHYIDGVIDESLSESISITGMTKTSNFVER
ncbi:MAG: hypothetical protein SNF68_07165 [Rikenellaceae bacterium]